MFTLAEILDLALRIEENGRLFYLHAKEHAADPQLKALLGWMAEEEGRHGAWFADLRRHLDLPGASAFFEEMTREVLGDLLGRRTFSLDEVDLKALASCDQVLDAALEFEHDTVLFYEILTDFARDDAVRDQLRAIIAEEQNHIRQLQAKQARTARPVGSA